MKRLLAAALAVALVLGLVVVGSRAETKMPKIGFVEAGSSSANPHFLVAFRRGLRDLGYVEGQSIVVEDRWAEGRPERLRDLIAELVEVKKVDVVVVASTPGAVAAKSVTSTVPVVFWGVSDPVRIGVAATLAHPGGNITGVSLGTEDGLAGKWLELLKQAVPALAGVAVLRNPDAPGLESRVRELRTAAPALKLAVQFFDVRSPSDFERAFGAIARAALGGLVVVVDPLTLRYRDDIVRLVARHRLPAIYGFAEFVRAGGLLAYGPSVDGQAYRAATYVDRILKGAKPADLPVEQPTKYDLVINLKAARALGLTMPPALLLRADSVME